MFVAGSEPPALRALGSTDGPNPEQFGVDYLWLTPNGWAGAQRKEVRDLVASIRGDHDRLAREITLMKTLTSAAVIVEGSWRWTEQGNSMASPGFTRSQYRGVVLDLQFQGIHVLTSDNHSETAACLTQLERWTQRAEHNGLLAPRKARAWLNTYQDEDFARHLWMNLPGVRVTLARRLFERFGLPWRWTITEADLRTVDGIGKKKAAEIYAAIPPREESAEEVSA